MITKNRTCNSCLLYNYHKCLAIIHKHPCLSEALCKSKNLLHLLLQKSDSNISYKKHVFRKTFDTQLKDSKLQYKLDHIFSYDKKIENWFPLNYLRLYIENY